MLSWRTYVIACLDDMAIKLTDMQRAVAQRVFNRVLQQTGSVEEAIDITGMAYQESRFKPTAIGPKTKYGRAQGLLQFIPATAQRFGITDVNSIDQQVDATIKYRQYLRNYLPNKGVEPTRANLMAAHNAGEGNVTKYKGIPPFKETRNYVSQISARSSELIPKAGISLKDASVNNGRQPIAGAAKGSKDMQVLGRGSGTLGSNTRGYVAATTGQQANGNAQQQASYETILGQAFNRQAIGPVIPQNKRDVLNLPTLDAQSIYQTPLPGVERPQQGSIHSAVQPTSNVLDTIQLFPGVFETYVSNLAAQGYNDALIATPYQTPIPGDDSKRRAVDLFTGRLING